jgi:hypothetical protein
MYISLYSESFVYPKRPCGLDHPKTDDRWGISTSSVVDWYVYPGGGRTEEEVVAERIISSEFDTFMGAIVIQ